MMKFIMYKGSFILFRREIYKITISKSDKIVLRLP